MKTKAFKTAFPYTLPIMTSFLALGLAYGIYMNASGFSFVYPMVTATMFTRFFPFAVFSSSRPIPKFVQYLGKALPCAIFGMLIVYCLKDVSLLKGSHGIPEGLGILATVIVHRIKGSMLLSILCGTVCYMLVLHTFA